MTYALYLYNRYNDMKNFVMIAIATALLLSSCGTTKHDMVRYTVAQRYFVNNNVDGDIALIKAVNEDELNKYFGMAAVMGKDGMPTIINFKKDFAIGVTIPESNGGTEINPVSLKKTGDEELTLTYSVIAGTETSYKVKPLALIVVSKKYENYRIKLERLQ